MSSKIKDELIAATGYKWAPNLSDSENRYRTANAADQFADDDWYKLSKPAQSYCESVAAGLPEDLTNDPDYINKAVSRGLESPQFPDWVEPEPEPEPEPTPAPAPATGRRRRAPAAAPAEAAPVEAAPAEAAPAASRRRRAPATAPAELAPEAAAPSRRRRAPATATAEAAPEAAAPSRRRRAPAASDTAAPEPAPEAAPRRRSPKPEPAPEPEAAPEADPVAEETKEVITQQVNDADTSPADKPEVKGPRGEKMLYLRKLILENPLWTKKQYLAACVEDGMDIKDSTVSLIMYNTKHTLTVLEQLGFYVHPKTDDEMDARLAEMAKAAG